ncbi:YceI family protein [Reichenbachiella versicolor]|uniref:YceI family protein n=1 Tax=Reichenbachiella versicolor TaxID=1821036 RepID=UPI000D6E0060|nr:YceI family protein [Reichenbachiella versicolor]
MKYVFVIYLLTLTVFTSNAQSIVADQSYIEFKIGNMGMMSVSGTIEGMVGEAVFNEDNLASSYFNVAIDPSSIDTDNKKRDEHLQNEDFFNVSKYLEIEFKSKNISKVDTKKYLVKGELTMVGVTQNVEIPFTASESEDIKTLEGKFEVNRSDYQLGMKAYSGGFMVGKTAQVSVKCVLK